jgi:hypothetical protein
MRKLLQSLLIGGTSLTVATLFAFAAMDTPTKLAAIDQNIDQATLQRLHYTDQGTRLVPAAWLVALEKADGNGKFMSTENMRRLGFIVDNVVADDTNPYGWPLGLAVSDPKTSDGIQFARPDEGRPRQGTLHDQLRRLSRYQGTAQWQLGRDRYPAPAYRYRSGPGDKLGVTHLRCV